MDEIRGMSTCQWVHPDSVVDTRCVLTWRLVRGGKDVKARFAAKGCREPDLRGSPVETSGRARLRASRPQVISRGALKRWNIWSLNIKNALSQADGFGREVFVRAPLGWGPKTAYRIRKLRAPASGLKKASAAFQRTLGRYLLNSGASLSRAGLKFQVSSPEPRLNFVFRKSCEVAGAITTHTDDILGRSGLDLLFKVCGLLKYRFGDLKVQEDGSHLCVWGMRCPGRPISRFSWPRRSLRKG